MGRLYEEPSWLKSSIDKWEDEIGRDAGTVRRFRIHRQRIRRAEIVQKRAIGVSNFYPDHFIDIASNMEIVPAVNQVETHVFDQQVEQQRIMEEFGTQIMSWGPLAEGRNGFFTNPMLAEIGGKYGKSVAQVALRWLIQRGVIIIPKSTHIERMRQNIDIFDFALSEDDMAAISTLDTGKSLFFDHHDAETVRMFMGWR